MIVVVGGGAIGLLVAGRLAQSGQQVGLLGRGVGVAALRAGPLRVQQDGHEEQVAGLVASSHAQELAAYGPVELAIVAVKGYDTAGAITALKQLRPGAVLTLQNGLGNEELLAGALGADRVLAGAITSSVVVAAPDTIQVTKAGGIGLAQVGPVAPLARWAEVLARAGFTCREYGDYRALKWSKALLNMLANATSAILDMPPDAVYADQRLVALEQAAQREALAAMDAQQIVAVNLPRYPAALLAWAERSLPLPLLQPVLRKLVVGGRGGKMPSLHGDLLRGRSNSEAEQLYGAVAAACSRLGLPAPINSGLWAIIEAITCGREPWEQYRRQPERLLAAIAEGHR